MSKFYSILVALVVTLFASSSFAWNPPASPAPKSWISDTSHILSDDAHARLDAKLKVINQSSANEVAALVVATLDGENITDVADATFKSWGVGKKEVDNGVLVVLAMKEHKSHITTGKGVEGDLPDLKASDILVGARPYLRKGDVEGALGFIFDSSSSAIANHKAEAAALAAKKAAGGDTATTTTTSSSRTSGCDASGAGASSGGGWLLVVGLGALGLLWWVLASRAKQRRELEELERQNREERARQRRLAVERETRRREEEARLQRERSVSVPTPVVPVPSIPRPVATVPRPAPRQESHPVAVATAATVAAGVALAAAEEETRRHRAAEAERSRREREEAESRRRREREEEDRRRRQREDDERSSSSSSSSSSFDWGGSSGGSDSGGFGGGDSGGGGASGDW